MELGHSPTLELKCSPALELGYNQTLRIHSGVGARKRSGIGARLQKIPRMYSGIGARMQEETAAWGQLQTRGGRKNNKALIKAEGLKGLLAYPTYKLFRFSSAILKIDDGKIC